MSLMSDLGTKVGGEFKAHRLRLEAEHKATQYQRDITDNFDPFVEDVVWPEKPE
jgi:hypothetical protein